MAFRPLSVISAVLQPGDTEVTKPHRRADIRRRYLVAGGPAMPFLGSPQGPSNLQGCYQASELCAGHG